MRRAFTPIESLTEKENKLDDVLVLLTEAQIATQQSFQETDRTDERFVQIGERIENLVSAIGALLRDMPI
jgi:hypothetical protein